MDDEQIALPTVDEVIGGIISSHNEIHLRAVAFVGVNERNEVMTLFSEMDDKDVTLVLGTLSGVQAAIHSLWLDAFTAELRKSMAEMRKYKEEPKKPKIKNDERLIRTWEFMPPDFLKPWAELLALDIFPLAEAVFCQLPHPKPFYIQELPPTNGKRILMIKTEGYWLTQMAQEACRAKAPPECALLFTTL